MKLAILDIGTNSIHLVLVEISRDLHLEVLDRDKEMIRLGEMSFCDGHLSEKIMERGIATIKRFKKLIDIRGVQKIKAIATSAVREAKNGGEFIERIEKETGIKVNVITGDEEARLIYLAVKHSISLGKNKNLIMDIGGGSVEIILANDEGINEVFSLKLGTLRLKSLFLKHDRPTKKEIKNLEEHIAEALESICQKIKDKEISTLIGTSGTIINLATMVSWLQQNAPLEMSNHFKMKISSLQDLHDTLLRSTRKERLKIKGIDPSRADMIMAGSAVLLALASRCGLNEITLCDEAIREGMLYDYMARNRSKIEMENEYPDIRMRSVLQLAKKCDYEEKHAHHVAQLALALFDQTKRLHHLSSKERELLHFAAILHDVGYHINYKKHHRHTYYLIKNGDLNGFEEGEIETMANMARYHCKGAPKKGHENWQRLSEHEKPVVQVCASILRLADSLDRSHFSVIRDLKAASHGEKISIQISAASDPELELWSAQKKKQFFEDVFGRKVKFKIKNLKGKGKKHG